MAPRMRVYGLSKDGAQQCGVVGWVVPVPQHPNDVGHHIMFVLCSMNPGRIF